MSRTRHPRPPAGRGPAFVAREPRRPANPPEYDYPQPDYIPAAYVSGRAGPHLPGCLAMRDPSVVFFTPCTCAAVAAWYALDFATMERQIAVAHYHIVFKKQ